MVSAFYLFVFGIAACLSWQNYKEDSSVGKLVFACGCSIAAILLGIETIIILVNLAMIFAVAIFALVIVGGLYDYFVNGITHWDNDDDFMKEYEIVMTTTVTEDDEEEEDDDDDEEDEEEDE